jgi:hypothetical protein
MHELLLDARRQSEQRVLARSSLATLSVLLAACGSADFAEGPEQAPPDHASVE